jgi:enhancing lycopene biosynthesis protein 2
MLATTGVEMEQTRNVMVESSRICRGAIASLAELATDTSGFDALIIPGGFGAASDTIFKFIRRNVSTM